MPNFTSFEIDGEKKCRWETPIAKLWPWHEKIETGASGEESKGIVWCWKRKRYLLPVEKKGSVRRRTNAVSGMRVMSVQNRHEKPIHPLNHQHKEVEVRAGKGTSEAQVHLGRPIDSRAKTSEKVLAPKHLVTVGILPNVICKRRNFGTECSLPALEVWRTIQQNVEERWWQKCSSNNWIMYDSWVAFSSVQSRRNIYRIYGRPQKSWDQLDEYGSQKLRSVMQTSEKTKVHRSEFFRSKFLISAVPNAPKFEDRSLEEIERQERCARGDAWRLAKSILKLKRTELRSSH